jgi:hypothetical protein
MRIIKRITSILAPHAGQGGKTRRKAINLPANKYYRADCGIEFKSSMEANIWRFYTQLARGVKLEYEPEIFFFKRENNIQVGNNYQAIKTSNPYNIKGYVPDFRVTTAGHSWYIEVKGKVDILSLEKARLLKVYYPWIKLYFITPRSYNLIKKYYSHQVKGWE